MFTGRSELNFRQKLDVGGRYVLARWVVGKGSLIVRLVTRYECLKQTQKVLTRSHNIDSRALYSPPTYLFQRRSLNDPLIITMDFID